MSSSPCPHCKQPIEATPDTAPGTYDCPYCNKPFQWPAAPSAAAYQPQTSETGEPDPGTLLNIKLVGIFSIVCGLLTVLPALYWVLELCLLPWILEQDRSGTPAIVFVLVFAILLVLAAVTAIIQITAGVKILKRSPGARTWGIVSAIAGCIHICGCCVYPLTLAGGIYSLVILLGEKVRRHLN